MSKKKEVSLEGLLEKLEDTIEKLQAPDVSLEESFQLYKQGMDDIRICNDIIDKVEKKVLMLNQEGDLDELGN